MAIKRLPSTGDAPRSTGVPASLVPGGTADSAGFPWAGRDFDHHETAFAGDDGETPAEYERAVAQLRQAAEHYQRAEPGAQTTALAELAAAHAAVIHILSRTRLLVPLLAEAGELGVTPQGHTVEKTQELSIVTVAGPDGRTVMPAFSSTAAMRRWDPAARPIPVPGPQLAVAAAQEGTDLIVIDPGTAESDFGVRRPALAAIALGEAAQPAWADAEVRAAFAAAIGVDGPVEALALMPGDPAGRLAAPEIEVHLKLSAGVDREAWGGVLRDVQSRLAADAVIAERVDSLTLVPHFAA